MVKKFIKLLFTSVGVGTLWTFPSQAADLVIIKYKIFRQSISVPDLRTFADTGELTPELEANLRTKPKKTEELRKTLSYKISADPVILSKVLNSLPGEILLDYMGEIVHTPSDRANREALRGALILSALGDNQIQLIEVLENYGPPEVHLEAERLIELLKLVEKVSGVLPRVRF